MEKQPYDPFEPTNYRDSATLHFVPLFAYAHLPKLLQTVSKPFCDLAMEMIEYLPDGPELVAGLRKLMEAKDCMIRAKVLELNDRQEVRPAGT